MVSFYGDYNLTESVRIPFNTFTSDDPSASVTITDLVAGDVEVHKEGVLGTPTGITVSIDQETTGTHLVILDLSDTNDAGFYANGSRYQVRIEGTTVDGATINAWIGAFSIGCILRPATAGRTVAVDASGRLDLSLIEGSDATDQITAAANTSIEAYNLDHLAKVADNDDVVDDSIIAKLASTDADWSNFANNTDSLQAIRDRGDSAWPTATTVALTTAGQQDVSLLINARPTWYVNKSGGDGDSGTSWDDAFLTVGAAVSAASAGDLIMIGPGTYAEAVDASGTDNLEFIGAGPQTHIQVNSQYAFKVGNGTTVRNLKSESTSATTGVGLLASSNDDVRLENVIAVGPVDGLIAWGARLRITNCYISSGFDAWKIATGTDFVCENSIFETDGAYVTADSDIRAVYGYGTGGSGVFLNCQLIARRSSESVEAVIAFGHSGTGQYLFHNTLLISEHSHASSSGNAIGVGSTDGTGSVPNINLAGCQIYTSQSGSGAEYHLSQASGTLSVDAATQYDTAKTNGTITNLGGTRVWAYVLPTSPSANTAADYVKDIDAVVGGITNIDTTNQVAFHNRSNTEVRRITFGSDDGSRTASTIS